MCALSRDLSFHYYPHFELSSGHRRLLPIPPASRSFAPPSASICTPNSQLFFEGREQKRRYAPRASIENSPSSSQSSSSSTLPSRCQSLDQRLEYDVVIVGAGVIGLSIAHKILSETHLSVALVDAARPCSGATGAG